MVFLLRRFEDKLPGSLAESAFELGKRSRWPLFHGVEDGGKGKAGGRGELLPFRIPCSIEVEFERERFRNDSRKM